MELPRKQLFDNKRLALLIVPILMEQLLSVLVGMVDGIMVSSVGEDAVSGVSLVGNISAVMLNLFFALAAGGGIVTSQLLGASHKKEARRSSGQLITMVTLVSLALMALCLVAARPMLRLFFGDVEKRVMDASLTYFFYNALSYPFLALISAGGAILRANGNSKVAFYVSLVRNGVNIAGNALCIYGLGMGVEGVAIPTAISRVVGAVCVLLVVAGKRQPLRPSRSDIFRIDGRLMRRMTRVGIPTALESSVFQLGRVVTLGMISGFGTSQIAANSTAGALCNFVVCVCTTYRMASLTVVGQCVGARDMQQIRQNFKKLLLGCYVFNGLVSVAVVLLRYPLLGLYQELEPDTVDLAAQLMCVHLLSGILLYPASFWITGPLRAANDSAFPMWVSILSMAIFRLTLAQILCVNLGWGAIGVWVAMVVDWVCRSTCFTLRWRSGAWKKKCGLDALPEKT